MNWLVYLSGDDYHMDTISKSVPEIIRPCPDGRYAMLCESRQGLSAKEDIQKLAEEKVALIRGISILVLNEDISIEINAIRMTERAPDEFRQNVTPSGNHDIIISCDEDDEEEIFVRSPFESVYLVTAAQNCLCKVIKEIPGKFGTWEGFLKIYREIESCTGNPVGKGWCSEDELEWFLYSAGANDSAGTFESTGPMYISEAESFVTILLQEWIKEKKRGLNI